MVKHIDINIKGRVQGVFFRKSAQEKAKSLGVSGFARNMPDGSLYIEAEGEENRLNKFLTWCRIGPKGARVLSVDCDVSNAPKNHRDFKIG